MNKYKKSILLVFKYGGSMFLLKWEHDNCINNERKKKVAV